MPEENTAHWEKELAAILDAHFLAAENRVPVFINELKNPIKILSRNFKFTALDFFRLLYNILARIINFICRKNILEERELFTETSLRKKFDEQVFHAHELDQKLQVYFKKLDKFIIETIEQRTFKDGLNPKLARQIIDSAIKRLTAPPDITKLIIVETAIPIFCSYYFAHKLTKGFGPVGAMLAQSYYKGQWSFWENILYWVNLKKIPMFVTISGSLSGFIVGLLVVAPLLNALIELVFSLFRNPGPQLIQQLRHSRKLIFGAGLHKRQAGANKIIFEKMNILGEILDYVKDMYLLIK